jgi:hypothetical protein
MIRDHVQNKFAEAEIANNLGRRAYEAGQADERAATTQAQNHDQPAVAGAANSSCSAAKTI